MINSPKNMFSIKDLENLTGIKAHTIRIWEKRYSILEPQRGDNNTRIYDIHSLQKLLNINTLNKFGYKISAISKLPEERIPTMVKEILSNKTLNDHVVNNFKVAMLNFDVQLFNNTFSMLLVDKLFRDIFYDCFMPLLEEIGNLWQTDTITPAQEHFMSTLIKQKISNNIEKLQAEAPSQTERVFVLYLPDHEIHEIGLMMLHYELLVKGFKVIYIGKCVPVESLADIKNYFENITFITYFTTQPAPNEVSSYIAMIKDRLMEDEETKLCLFGNNSQYVGSELISERITRYNDIKRFADAL